MPQLSLHYHALLREQRGLGTEVIATDAADPGALYAELRAAHGFTLDAAQLKVAVNGDFAAWDHPLADGDEVVFLPPVSGG